MSFENVYQFIYVCSYFPFGFVDGMCDLIASVPDHCPSFYFDVFNIKFCIEMGTGEGWSTES